MGHESNERGSGVAIVVVIVVLLGVFALLCAGTGALMLFGVRSAVPIAPARAVRVSPYPATQPGAYSEAPEPVVEADEITVETPVFFDRDGTIRIAGAVVPLEQVEDHLGRVAKENEGQSYLFLDVQVAPDCRAAPLVDFLDRVRRLEFCEVELSLADQRPDTRE